MITQFEEKAREEIWQPIPGIPYEASSTGRIRSMLREPPKVMNLTDNGAGYLQVGLAGRRCGRVNILVCSAFNGPRPDGYHCAHLNGDRKDNRPENLAWVSQRENEEHKILHGRLPKGSKNGIAKLDEERVRRIKSDLKNGIRVREISKRENVSNTTIYYIKNRRLWCHVE